jgi:hypothetical protein
MKVNIPVLLLGIIILIQLYINFFLKIDSSNNQNDESEAETLETLETLEIGEIGETDTFVNNQSLKGNVRNTPEILNRLGRPTVNNNEYMLWVINKPKPWEEIIYKFDDPFPIKFIKTVFIPNNDIYNKWKEIIPNIEINKNKLPNKVKLIIPARDEESALGILNLMLNTFKNQLSFEEIMKNNLIEVSLAKIKKHPMVKQKILEQIMEIKHKNNTEEDEEELDIDSSEFEKDLANTETVKNVNEVPAYGGNEFSFL